MGFGELLKGIGKAAKRAITPTSVPGYEGLFTGPTPMQQIGRGLELLGHVGGPGYETVAERQRKEDYLSMQEQIGRLTQRRAEETTKDQLKTAAQARQISKYNATRASLENARSKIEQKLGSLDPSSETYTQEIQKLRDAYQGTFDMERNLLGELGVTFPKELTSTGLLTSPLETAIAQGRTAAEIQREKVRILTSDLPNEKKLQQIALLNEMGMEYTPPTHTEIVYDEQGRPFVQQSAYDLLTGEYAPTGPPMSLEKAQILKPGEEMKGITPPTFGREGTARYITEGAEKPVTGGITAKDLSTIERNLHKDARDTFMDFYGVSKEGELAGIKRQMTDKVYNLTKDIYAWREAVGRTQLPPQVQFGVMNKAIKRIRSLKNVKFKTATGDVRTIKDMGAVFDGEVDFYTDQNIRKGMLPEAAVLAAMQAALTVVAEWIDQNNAAYRDIFEIEHGGKENKDD